MMETGTRSDADSPVAIVGIGCRYGNGVNNVSDFWQMLSQGLDCTGPIPPGRFDASYFLSPGPKAAGKMYIQNGGYISQDPYMFDRQFFKMPPDEACHLDPQVRLLLEVAWEALENAGVAPSSIRGSKTGVYMGVTAQEYIMFSCKPYHNMNQYSNSGTNSCMVANRISYEFDLRGPSFSVDTACSSSLYSIHLACQALRQNSCSMALAGGVNLILTPGCSIGFCQAGMLSPDGKCKSFDQSADGYSRSEGAGVLVLKPLSEALKCGDRVYAVLRGGALSNDGRTPGIANPSHEAQEDLIREACRNASIHPHEVVYAEAHGTGTRVGDKTEVSAIGEVMGRKRGAQNAPLYIGSVKSNLGHSEGAAGVAGIIKAALCLFNRKIPPVVHFKTPNENVDFRALQVNVPTALTPWPAKGRLLASCSSFGFGGANANVVLEGRPSQVENDDLSTVRGGILSSLLLSAATPDALNQRIKDWVQYLEENAKMSETTFYQSVYTTTSRSQHHPYRLGFAVYSREDALHQLRLRLDGANARCVEGITPSMASSTRPIVFVFTGMGSQWWGMARDLMNTKPAFVSKIKMIDKILKKCGAKWSLVKLLKSEEDRERINQTEISQPCLFAVAVGLVDLWKAVGVKPDVVVGHSVGEVAAAYAAGLLSLDQAVNLVYCRGRALHKTSGTGTMVAVLHSAESAIQLARDSSRGQFLDVAAVNSPTQVVFSGERSEVMSFADELRVKEVKNVVLKVNNAFHSRHQDVVQKPFLKKVRTFLKPQNAVTRTNATPMMSTVTGRYLTAEEASSPQYWFQNIRQRVSFMDALRNLARDGNRVFLEVGAHPALCPAMEGTFAELEGMDGFVTTASLLRPRDTATIPRDSENLLLSQMKLHVNGIGTDFQGLFPASFRRVASIPAYPWQRERCTNVTKEGYQDFLYPAEKWNHILLGRKVEASYLSQSPVHIWRSELDASMVPWLKDHVLQGAVVTPAAAYTETALAAARSLNDKPYPIVLDGLTFDRFMFAPGAEGCLESTVEEKTPERVIFTLRSYDESRGKWTQHCHGRITPPSTINPDEKRPSQTINIDSIKERCHGTMTGEDFYARAAKVGFELGPTFRGVRSVSISDDVNDTLVQAEAPPSVQREFHRYLYHPAFMDTLLQTCAVIISEAAKRADRLAGKPERSAQRVPKEIGRFWLLGPIPSSVLIHVKKDESSPRCDIYVADAETKTLCCAVSGLVFESLQEDKLEPQIWSTSWHCQGPLEAQESGTDSKEFPERVILFPDDTTISDVLLSSLRMKLNDSLTVVNGTSDDLVEEVIEILTANRETNSLLVMMRTGFVNLGPETDSILSKGAFESGQNEGALFMYDLCKALLANGLKTKILALSRGAYQTREGEDVNPFAASFVACGKTLNHEEPSMRLFNVDLPLEESKSESSEILHLLENVILNGSPFLHGENIVAVRSALSEDNQRASWECLSPRLDTTSVSKAKGVVPTRDWSVRTQRASERNQIRVQRSERREREDASSKDTVRVKVNAFSISTKQRLDGDGLSTVVIYAGSVKDDSNEKDKLGLQENTEVFPHMSTKKIELVDVPHFLTSAEAVQIVTDHLPSAVFLSQTVPVSPGMRLAFNLDALDADSLSLVHVATKLGAEAFIFKYGNQPEETTSASFTFLDDVPEASVDVLFLSVGSSSLDGALLSLLPKLRRNGFVVVVQRQGHLTRGLQTLPPKTKTVVFEDDLTSAVDGLTSSEISSTMSGLLQMFKPDEGGDRLSRHVSHKHVLSTDVDLPQGEVIEVKEEEVLLQPSHDNDHFVADEKSAYLITGGSRGFGLSLLDWLVSRGARYVYLGSRGTSDEMKDAIHNAAKSGARVQHLAMDISKPSDVERGLVRMRDGDADWPQLRAIFHCAAVFADAFFQAMTAESWNRVMAPKAYGALLLHQLTMRLGISLDHFVMTSSIVSLVGNPGQGSYCAANVFLNSLAEHRHARGLPATAVQIGVISNVGFAERRGLVQAFENVGMGSLTPGEVLGFIGCAVSSRQPLLGFSGSFNRKVYAQKNRALFTEHFRERMGTISLMKHIFNDRDLFLASRNDTLIQSIMSQPIAKAQEIVGKTLASILSKHLGLTEEVRLDSSPISLGLDSLMAAEVSQMISQRFEVPVGAVDLLNDKMIIRELAKNITKDILRKKGPPAAGSGPENPGKEASKRSAVIIEGQAPDTLVVKMVCFPSNGAGPSLFAQWVQPLLQYGIQLLMIQLPGWEGLADEQPLTKMEDLTRLIHDELSGHLSHTPFVFYGHSMGSLVAFEVAHRLLAEDHLCPMHLFVGAWYPPMAPYPQPKELDTQPATFEHLGKALENQPKLFASLVRRMNFSFLEESSVSNLPLMRRLIPCIQASMEILRNYSCEHQRPLPCGITALGGKQDRFMAPDLLNGWAHVTSEKNAFKRVTLPGKHMFILFNTAEILTLVCTVCETKKVVNHQH